VQLLLNVTQCVLNAVATDILNVFDCFKRALKASLFPTVGRVLQITAPLSNFLKGRYSEVYLNLTVQFSSGP